MILRGGGQKIDDFGSDNSCRLSSSFCVCSQSYLFPDLVTAVSNDDGLNRHFGAAST
eukprot:COSAG01_NODE_37281_length_505_cov_3.322660_1_plen_56_part_01